MEDGLIICGRRLFTPTTFCPTILARLHKAHQGITKSKDRSRLTVYWPGIDHDIEAYISNCKLFQDSLPSRQSELIITKPHPVRPFQQVGMDWAYRGGQYFLIVVDCYPDWPHIFLMGSDITSRNTIKAVLDLFCRTTAPDVIWSDGGSQFTSSRFQAFLKDWGVCHSISSPHYPQNNGKAESTIKSMKKIIKAAWRRRSLSQSTHQLSLPRSHQTAAEHSATFVDGSKPKPVGS